MIKKLILIVTGVLLFITVAMAELLNPLVLNQRVPDKFSSWDFTLSANGKPWFAYYGEDNTLYVRRPKGDEIGLGATDRPRMQSGLAMTPVGEDGLAVLWRDKLPQKNLYLVPKLEQSGTVPSPVVVGGEESEPLTRLKIARDKDVEYLLWLGEKGDPESKEQYHLYFRTAEQGGKVLSPVEQVMPGRYPAWIVDQDLIPVFSWMTYQGQLAMTMRVFDRAQKHFGPLVKIADAPPISPIFEAFKSGDRWFLIWLGHYGELGSELLLEGVYSDDRGQTWKSFALEELRGLDIGTIDVATDHHQHLVIALDGSRRLIDPQDDKPNIYIVRSTDNGATWQKSQTLRPDEVLPTKAQYPLLASGKQPGTIMLAWEDWRAIRPNIFVSYSRDYGATWEPALPLGRPGVWNLALDPYPRVLLNHEDRFLLVAKQFGDDSLFNRHDYVLYSFSWDEARKNADAFNLSEAQARATEARLRERATVYWQAMQDGQYETAYALMDPFFRHARDLETYLSQMGIIKYHHYQVGQIIQKGNIAKVLIEIESSVPEFETPSGQTISQPARKVQLVETWIFVNNDWYREYYDQKAERPLTRY